MARRSKTVTPAPRVRWDRLGRWVLLLVLGVVLSLYINPLRNWVSTYGEAQAKQHELSGLKRQQENLRKRINKLTDVDAVEMEARELGMIAAGEREYVVKHLPKQLP